jgi:rhodanese-related sulfurtransferase
MKLVVHPGAEAWRPSQEDLDKLARTFRGVDLDAHLWPRSAVRKVFGRRSKPYAFRAFTRNSTSHLFVDGTETPKSIAWLLAHELCHQQVAKNPDLVEAFDDAQPIDLDPAGDQFHEVDAEERFCDGVATRIYGIRLDRAWWRNRVSNMTKFGEAPRDICWDFRSTPYPDIATARATARGGSIEAPGVPEIRPLQLRAEIRGRLPPQILDVRPATEMRGLTLRPIPGSVHVPVHLLEEHALRTLNPKLPVVVVCKKGLRSACAVPRLQALGFNDVRSLRGGLRSWYGTRGIS